jgi:hypothetical protein
MSTPDAANFLDSYHALEDAKLEIQRTVNAGVGTPLSGRQLRVSYLLLKLLAHIDSLLNIIQNHFQYRIDQAKRFKWRRTRFYPFDHHSICSLGRVCFDAALMLHYLSEPSLNIAAWNLRRKVLYLHDISNRHRFLKFAKKLTKGSLPEKIDDKWIIDGLVADILMHLSELGRATDPTFTSGQMVYVDGVRGAVREAGWDVNEFEFQQAYLSNFVHTHPVSYMRATEHAIDFEKPSAAQYAAALIAVSVSLNAAKSSNERCLRFLSKDGDQLADYFDSDGMQISASGNL